jgi:hypothetical protein
VQLTRLQPQPPQSKSIPRSQSPFSRTWSPQLHRKWPTHPPTHALPLRRPRRSASRRPLQRWLLQPEDKNVSVLVGQVMVCRGTRPERAALSQEVPQQHQERPQKFR